MIATATHIVEAVLPKVLLRQWVLSEISLALKLPLTQK
jgi:hypothetical protein